MNVSECSKKMKCAVSEDKNSALELEKAPKMRPRTKHTAIKHRNFRSFAQRGDIFIEKVDTAEKENDFLTKLIAVKRFC